MSREQRRALIVGPYRAHNFGDDLVGAILARHLQSLGYEVTIPRLSESNSAWLGSRFAENYEGQFERADVVVVGGGGIMSDTSGAKPGASYLEIASRAHADGLLHNTPVYVTSVGAGPWLRAKSRVLAQQVAGIAQYVGVREQESYDHLRAIGVDAEKLVLGADLALLTPELLAFTPRRGKRLGLQFDVTAFPDVQENPHLPAIVAAVGDHARSRARDVVLIRNGRARSEIADLAPKAERLSYTSLERFLPQLGGMRALFTSHLHLAITAYSQRIPTYSLFVREKTRRFYEQIGHPERAIDLRTATLADAHRFLAAAAVATWTTADEERLRTLKADARSLLSFVA
ncbi:polysaccharide pyruvyl transferase family protein [Microbacterium aurum]